MKRLLVVAGDRALTKFVAESLVGHGVDGPQRDPSDPWEISRAHSALEALILVTRGGRPFDTILVDQTLPDKDGLKLLEELREQPASECVPLFLLTERGRDPHTRRVAAEQFGVVAFIEKPVTAEILRTSLSTFERPRSVLIADGDAARVQRHKEALERAGFAVFVAESGNRALARAAELRPDIVIASLVLDDMRGTAVCVELKKNRARGNLPVILFGQFSALAEREIGENAHRADDFLQAPFDEEILVERVLALTGRGSKDNGQGTSDVPPTSPPSDAPAEEGLGPRRPNAAELALLRRPTAEFLRSDLSPGALRPPPRSASPAPVAPTKRSTRRVPCLLSASIRDGAKVYDSKTFDISHGGIFLATDAELAIGTLIDLSFQFPDSDRVITAVGKVAWVSARGASASTPAGVGVKFCRIEPADLELIVDYVNRVSHVLYSAM